MKGKNKKLLWFEAGVLIVAMTTLSFGSSICKANLPENKQINKITVENYFGTNDQKKFPLTLPTGTPLIEYINITRLDGTNIIILRMYISDGTPPYTVTIDWGDGEKPDNKTTNDGYIFASHNYEICRTKPYRIYVQVTDSVGGYARGKTDVIVRCPECDLSVSLRDLPGNNGPFHCENEEIMFRVTVKSTDNTDFCICDKFLVSLTIHSSCGAPYNKTYGPISPGQTLPIDMPCCQACGPGKHTAIVTIIPIDIIDNYPGNNVASHDFYIFSEETCYILNKIFGFFQKRSGSVVLDEFARLTP